MWAKREKNLFSNYICRIEAKPVNWLTLNYRFSFKQALNPQFAEIGGSIAHSVANISGNYVFINKITNNNRINSLQNNLQKCNLFFTLQFMTNWSFTGSLTQGLEKRYSNRKDMGYGVSSYYRKDDLTFGLTMNRQSFAGLKPSTMVTFSLNINGPYSGNLNEP
jgi:hypothetical protein